MTQPNPNPPAPLTPEELAARTKLAARLRKLHAESGTVEWIYDSNSNLDSSTVLFYDESEDEYRDVCQMPCQVAPSDYGFEVAVNPAVGEFIVEAHNCIIDLLDERDALLASLDAHQQENHRLCEALQTISGAATGSQSIGDFLDDLQNYTPSREWIDCIKAAPVILKALGRDVAALTPPAGAKE